MARLGKGRKRIVMQKMPKKSALQVTFSKRRSGLMKKASELCTLCAAQILLVVFSPGGKVFSFGHPSVESIIRRFLGEEPEQGREARENVRAHQSCSNQKNLNLRLNQLEGLVDDETEKGVAIDVTRSETEGSVWWERPMNGFNLEQLERFMERVVTHRENLRQDICLLLQDQRALNGGPGLPPNAPRNEIYGGSVNGLPSSQAQLDPMAAGGSNGQDPRMHGFYGGLPYDPMMVEASNQMIMGSTGPLGFQARPSVDPNAPGPSNVGFGAIFDVVSNYYGMYQGSNQI